jgi:CubicO group peptidase (beta-lactamase class C family)
MEARMRKRRLNPLRPKVALALAAVLGFALMAGPGPLASQVKPAIPDTEAGKRLAQLVEVLNTGSPAVFKKFISQEFSDKMVSAVPMARHLSIFGDIHDKSRGYDLVRIDDSKDYSIRAVYKNRLTEGFDLIMVNLESAAPHKIEGLGVRPTGPGPGTVSEQPLTEKEMAGELDRFVKKLAAADVFSGAVLVERNGRKIYEASFGQAVKGWNLPNRVDTKFNLGSMNKMFTAVSIAELVEKGKLSYEDSLDKFLGPDWLKPEAAKKIRIKHLLSHTSGLGSYFNDKYQNSSRALFRAVDDYKPLVIDDAPAFEPGTQWQYSNTGMLLLGAVIEKVTGGSYFDYVRENVYKPAGMTASDAYEMDLPVPNLAIGYDKEFLEDGTIRFRNNLYMHVIKGGPAGGGFSTVGDLVRFAGALSSGKLVSRDSYALLTSPKPDLKSPEYGFGFSFDKDDVLGRIVGHSGGFPGINSNLDIFQDRGVVAAVMSNYSGGAQAVQEKIRELLKRLK